MRIGPNDSIPGLGRRPIWDFGPWAGLRTVISIDGMTAVLNRPSPPTRPTRPVDALTELATAALDAA